jgi:hypothetical protein
MDCHPEARSFLCHPEERSDEGSAVVNAVANSRSFAALRMTTTADPSLRPG